MKVRNTLKIFLAFYIISTLFIVSLKSQTILSFPERVEEYRKQNSREMVFIHTDRGVYSSGDVIKFHAFVRNVFEPAAITISQNVHLIIVDPFGRQVQEKIFTLENNHASGEMELTGNIGTGEHTLVAWTNTMEKGDVNLVFKKKLFITERMIPDVLIFLDAGETPIVPGSIARVQAQLLSNNGKALKKKKISYIVSHNGSAVLSNSAKTDKEGNANIELMVPEFYEPGLVIFEAAVEHMGKTIANSIMIPTTKTPVWMDFAPEGGLFVDGFETRIAFKAYDYLGKPVQIEGQVVTGDNELIKNISSDPMGFGLFSLKADFDKYMKVRLTKPAGIDIDIKLPVVQENGIQLKVASRDNKQISFDVNTDIEDAAIPLHAVAEFNGSMHFEKRFNLNNSSEFTIPLEGLDQTGVLKVNLLNRSGQPVAHRSIFISGSGTEYIEADNLQDRLSLKKKGTNSDKTRTFLSYSVVEELFSPIWENSQDIMSWFLLGPSASYANFPAGFLANPNEEEQKTIDAFMLFQMDNDINWERIKTNKKSAGEKTNDEFRKELENYYQADDFERLISDARTTQFFISNYVENNPDFLAITNSNRQRLEEMGYLPGKLTNDEKVRQQLASGKSIMSVLMTVKPYKMVGNKIVFRGNDSFNYQGGVIIVIDGVARGTDPGVLNSISPHDVETIRASANIADIQKYSGLNSTGVIEITTKKGPAFEPDNSGPKADYPTLLWDPAIYWTDEETLDLDLPKTKFGTRIYSLIQGMDSDGRLYIWTNK